MRLPRRVDGFGLVLFVAAVGGLGERQVPRRPPPIDRAGEADEEADDAGRRAWIAAMHAAPPGVDWVAIERANGLAQRDKRNTLATLRTEGSVSAWTERGSDNQAGRIFVAARSPDGERLYAGSADGGVWMGTPDGSAWEPIGDNVYGGAQLLTVLSAEGGGDVVVSATSWGAVNRTDDGGATWTTPDGLANLDGVRRIVTTSDGGQTVFLVGSASAGYGLYRSTDGAASFTRVASLGSFAGDVWVPRDGGSRVYLVADDTLEVSDDGGTTFTPVGSPDSGASDERLVGSEAGAPRLWILASHDGSNTLYRSDDAGATWARVTDVSDYYGAIGASAVDADVFVIAGVELHRTGDGGETFASVNAWGDYYDHPDDRLHADVWSAEVVPEPGGGETWYVGTDGGLFRSTDGLATVENLSLTGLRVGQYYGTLTSSADPTHIAAGAQDQGYQIASGPAVGGAPGGSLLDFDQALSGDYGHLTSGDGTHRYVFSDYPGFVLVQEGETDPTLAYLDFPGGETYAWLPPLVADPTAPADFFFAASHLYHYEHHLRGDSWDAVQWSDQDFARSDGEYLSALAFSPLDPDRAWAATNAGRLFWSDDRGVTWTRSSDIGPYAQYFYGTALVASLTDPDTVTVGGAGYGGAPVYRSRDGGRTWDAWDDGLPDTLVYGLAEAHDGSGRLYAATETAAYVRGPDDDAWVDISAAGAPVTPYWGVEAVPGSDTMRFASYGRGIWDYAVPALPEGDTGEEPANPDGPRAKAGCACAAEPAPIGSAAVPLVGFLAAIAAARRRRVAPAAPVRNTRP